MGIVNMSEIGFEADAVVGGVDVAARHAHPSAVHDVDAIIVPVGVAFHPDAVDHEVLAEDIGLHPACGVLDCDSLDADILAIKKLDHLRSQEPFGSLFREFILHRVDLPNVKQAVDVQCEAAALAVKCALPCDCDTVGLVGEK